MNRLAALIVLAVVAGSCGDSSTPESTLASGPDFSTTIVADSTTTIPATSTTAEPTTTTTTTTTTAAPTTTTTTTAAPTTTTTTTAAPTTTTTTTAAPTTTTTTTAAPTTTAVDYVAIGSQLATDNGCRNCHSTDGSVGIGPSWAGLAGSTVSLSNGSTVTANRSYLVESINSPDAKIVAGFEPGIMQTYFFTEEEIEALVAYISSR